VDNGNEGNLLSLPRKMFKELSSVCLNSFWLDSNAGKKNAHSSNTNKILECVSQQEMSHYKQ
jgi:hypothetical protein